MIPTKMMGIVSTFILYLFLDPVAVRGGVSGSEVGWEAQRSAPPPGWAWRGSWPRAEADRRL